MSILKEKEQSSKSTSRFMSIVDYVLSNRIDFRVFIMLVMVLVLGFIFGITFNARVNELSEEVQRRGTSFCAITDRSAKIEMVDWTTTKLFFEVSCE